MNKIIKDIKENYKLVIGVLITGLVLGWIFFHSSGGQATTTEAEGHEGHNHEAEAETIWTCSMHPQIRQDKPGKCPICAMDLIPLASLANSDDDVNPDAIVMTESAAKLADIQTVIVSKGAPEKPVSLQGKIQADERNIAELTARFAGRIEKLFVNYTGQKVQKGEKLATIYSPDLITAQRELIEAIHFKESRPSLYNAAKAKLKLWDLSENQIADIEKEGVPQVYFDIQSPISGTITMRHVSLGDYVKEGTALFQVIDLSKVWGMFDAYESDLPWINTGDKVDFSVQALPGKNFSAKVSYIDPFINAKTRVAKVRVEISNRSGELKPEMFLNGKVNSQKALKGDFILIPKSSILWTGERAIVYVKIPDAENPSFLYREIELGPEAGNFYVVANGLNEGEEIATNGVFKIDAAAQLQGLPSMMNPKEETSGGTTESMDISDENIPAEFKKQLAEVYDAYLTMKNAFIKSEAHPVMMAAQEVEKAMGNVDMELLKGDAHMVWMNQLKTLKNTIGKISKSMDIKQQRIDFAEFNQAFYNSVKTFRLPNDTVYYQYCPMANNDEGAYWLSEIKEIRNPYFGDEMLECGETKETLK